VDQAERHRERQAEAKERRPALGVRETGAEHARGTDERFSVNSKDWLGW